MDTLIDQTTNRVFDYIEKRLTRLNEKNIVTMLDGRITVLMCCEHDSEAAKQMKEYQEDVYQQFGVRCAIGASNVFHHFENAKSRYIAAKQACKVSLANPQKPITVFRPYDIEMLIFSMNIDRCIRFYTYFFRNYKNQEQIQEDTKLLDLYIQHNRSISAVAEEMNMHKNTVQCHLDKFYSLTGLNPRNAKDLAYISLIITIGKHWVNERPANDVFWE